MQPTRVGESQQAKVNKLAVEQSQIVLDVVFSMLFHHLMQYVAVNAMRLAGTFLIGLLCLWMFGLIGAEEQRIYLALLGMRWLLAVPANALDMIAVPTAARNEQIRGNARHVSIIVLIASFALAFIVFGWGSVAEAGYTGAWAVMQCLTAPVLGRLVYRGHAVRHAFLLLLRRSPDVVALLMLLSLVGIETLTVPMFLATGTMVTFCVGAMIIWLGQNDVATGARAPWGLYGPSLMIAASQALGLRLPVLMLASFSGIDALPAAMAFVIGGYMRQVATSGMVGLDGVMARAHWRQSGGMFRHATLAHIAIMAFILGLTWVAMPWLVTFLLPPEVTDIPLLVIGIILIGVVLRSLGDLWIKLASGLGHHGRFAPVLIGAAVLCALGMGVALVCFPPALAPLGVAVIFVVAQAIPLISMAKSFRRGAIAQSLPAE